MKKSIRIITALLAFLMMCSLFVACKTTDNETPTGEVTTAGGAAGTNGTTQGQESGTGGGEDEVSEADLYRPEKLCRSF